MLVPTRCFIFADMYTQGKRWPAHPRSADPTGVARAGCRYLRVRVSPDDRLAVGASTHTADADARAAAGLLAIASNEIPLKNQSPSSDQSVYLAMTLLSV